MKILLFSHDAGGHGGASKSFLTVIKGLKSMGYQLMVIMPKKGSLQGVLEELEIPYEVIYCPWWFHPRKYYAPNILSKVKAYFLIPIWLPFYTLYYYVLSVVKIKSIIKTFQPHLLYSNTSATPYGFLVSCFYRIKHVWHVREFIEEGLRAKLVFGRLITHKIIKNNNFNIYLCKALAVKYLSLGDNYKIIPNAIYTTEELLEKKKFIKQRKPILQPVSLLCVGRVSVEKGLDVCIRTLVNLKEASIKANLKIIGNGNIDLYKSLAGDLEVINQVEFTGRVVNIEEYYLSHDILILASDKEAFGRVLIEAMAYGTIVIARKAGGVTDIVQEGKNGFLFTEEQEIVPLVKHILTLTAEELQQIRKQAYNDCLQNYTTEKLHENMDSIFQKLYKN